MSDALWYLARGTGVTALVLLTVVVVLGVANRRSRPAFGLPRFGVALVHRNASLLAVAFVGVHVVTLFFDPYAQLRLADLVLPFGAEYRPLWTGLGTLGVDLLAAVVVTSLLRQRLGVRAWRAVHWLAYACWPAAWLHALGAGSDAGTWWLQAVAGVSLLAVLAAVAVRAFGTPRPAAQGNAPGTPRPAAQGNAPGTTRPAARGNGPGTTRATQGDAPGTPRPDTRGNGIPVSVRAGSGVR
ncbi:ferric reductase-like transmembrane domain-containing protein [Dactylosporangium sp. NPDC005572]|uniref:ferric reductase-like transmembrane domain-containing protein n=1 Tax=Dactylosporangium sp. NPDC005572 TaxID=3156889 RepID=UPI0033A2B46E